MINKYSEVLDIPLDEDNYAERFYDPTIPQSLKEDDVYGLLANTMSYPSLPKELILTSDNFDEKIRQFKKTVVLFYLKCKVAGYIDIAGLLSSV